MTTTRSRLSGRFGSGAGEPFRAFRDCGSINRTQIGTHNAFFGRKKFFLQLDFRRIRIKLNIGRKNMIPRVPGECRLAERFGAGRGTVGKLGREACKMHPDRYEDTRPAGSGRAISMPFRKFCRKGVKM